MKTLPLQLQNFSLKTSILSHEIFPNHNPTMLPYLTLQTLSNSNTLEYIQITLNLHIPHALSKKSSILHIGNNPYINQSPSQCIFVPLSKTLPYHIHIGITSKPSLMPSSYKTQIIATPGYSTFIIP